MRPSSISREHWPAAPHDWQSVVADVVFRNAVPAQVHLTPITLGFGLTRPDRGIPRLADAAAGTRILQRLQKLSAPFGTKIEIKDGKGTILIPDSAQ